MGEAEEKVRELAAKAADSLGLELVDVELKRGKRRALLRVFIDLPEGGVTVDDCERMSRTLEPLLDVEDPIQGSYTIEVSSPGLDRPLRGVEDYIRFRGRLARVVTVEPVEGQSFFIGRLGDVKDGEVTLSTEKGDVTLMFDNISKARLEIEI